MALDRPIPSGTVGRSALFEGGRNDRLKVGRPARLCPIVKMKMRLLMEYFIQQLINGISLGAIYGLIAIGYTMVYGIIGMINFAHGEIYMIGAFVSLIGFLFMGVIGISYIPLALFLVLLMAMLFTAIYGWAVERIAYRPLRGSVKLAPLISAIGMSIVLQNYVQLAQGARVKPLQPIIQGGFDLSGVNADFHVRLGYLQIVIVLLTVVLMAGFTYVITRTPLGRAQRATEQDMTMASLLGVNVDRIISTTFVMGASLAAVAGLMVTLYYGVIDFYIGFIAGMKAFTAAVLGGIGSLPGAMLGGLLIGLIEAFWSGYFSIGYKDVAAFSILVLVLIFRPTGLLGKPEVEKV
jgi:branched-chain amino acid transport system permease protein